MNLQNISEEVVFYDTSEQNHAEDHNLQISSTVLVQAVSACISSCIASETGVLNRTFLCEWLNG